MLICFFTSFPTPALRGRLSLTGEESKINISPLEERGKVIKMNLLIELIFEF
jgi:hypothetical protein